MTKIMSRLSPGLLVEALYNRFGLFGGTVFERLLMAAEPGLDDAIALHACMHAVGNGLYFRQFGHE